MKLSEFLEDLDPAIEERGHLLYEDWAVGDLEERYLGHWTGRVQGSRLYFVEMAFEGEEVVDFSCDCPYDWGPVCKHIVAMALAIQEKNDILDKAKPRPPRKPTFAEEMEKVSKGLNRKDLLDFILEECKANTDLFEAFKLRFAGHGYQDSKLDYAEMVRKALEKASKQGEYGFIEESVLEELLEKLHKRAVRQFNSKNWDEVLEICFLLINNIPSQIERIPEDIQGVEAGVIEIIGILKDLLSPGVPSEIQKSVQDFLIDSMGREEMVSWGFDSQIWEALMETEQSEVQRKKIDGLFTRTLSNLEGGSGYSDWKVISWLKRKRNYLIQTGREREVAAALRPYMHHGEIRQYFVDLEIASENFGKAKHLVREGIRLESEKGWKGNVGKWRERLLDIAKLEDDPDEIRVHARELVNSGSGKMEYYDLLKSTFSPEDWKVEVERMIAVKLGGKKVLNQFNAHTIATILVKESYFDRLLSLLKQFPHDYRLLRKFHYPLKSLFPKEILELFDSSIRAITKANTGRSFYHSLVEMLRGLEKLEGGIHLQRKLLNDFRVEYIRRKAMMEILQKAFPMDKG